MAVEFRLLGEIEVCLDGTATPLGHLRQRCVLAILLADANRTVSVAELVERVWGERPPHRANESVYTYLSRLRHRVAELPDVQLVRRSGGHLVTVDPLVIDMHLFRNLADGARESGDDAVAAAMLDRALALWRGEAFPGLDTPWINALRAELDRQRFAALLDRNDHALRAGRHADLLSELRATAAAHPLDERVAGQLMVALHHSGRQGDALRAYRDVRVKLVDELGADASPPLRELHERILTRDDAFTVAPATAGPCDSPPSATVPRQLPAGSRSFRGRIRELAELDELLSSNDDACAGGVVAVSGAGGVGKTALAVHWAHRNAHRFPDGQLYVDLRGFNRSDVRVAPGEAVRGFLEALGVHHQRIPTQVEAQVGLYRSLLATRRVLVVLDNALDVDHVRPLLPGAPGCLALVTSRHSLPGLVVTDGAVPLLLDLLSTDDARALLAGRLGADRVAAEPRAVEEIIALCARLPLPLAIVAARAAARRGLPLAALAEQLRPLPNRLDALDVGDQSIDVRAVFSWSYRTLHRDVARVFRLLGVHPGPDISVSAAASLVGCPVRVVRAALDELTRANLLTEPAPGRFAFHDLLRAYARELADSEVPAEEQDAAVRRMLNHYLQSANAADHLLYPHRDVVDLPESCCGTVLDEFGDPGQALDWFTRERRVLLAVAVVAAESRLDAYTWRLAWTMVNYLMRRGHWSDWIGVQDRALQAAARRGDRQGQAFAHRGMQRAYLQCGRQDDADRHGRRALRLFSEFGDRAGQAQTYLLLGQGAVGQKRYDDAVSLFLQAQDLYRKVGHEAGQANALNNAGFTYVLLGRYEQALEVCRQAISLQQKVGDRYMEGHTWDSLGYAHHHLGSYDAAIASYEKALRLLREQGERYMEADTLARLADSHDASGDAERARRSRRQALEIYEDLGHPDLEALRDALTTAAGSRPAGA